MISTEKTGKTALITLSRNVTNALNPELVEELNKSLKTIKTDNTISGAVLTGSNDKFFSIGWDIPELYRLNEREFRDFFRKFQDLCLTLFTFPKPVVAAIKGHAVAAGCILITCCDYRYIAGGKKLMGLNNLKNGLPLPVLPAFVLQSVVGTRNAREMVDSGDFYKQEQALNIGLVDKILPFDRVIPVSVEKARNLGALPAAAFSLMKKNRTEAVTKQAEEYMAENEKLFLECWFSDETRALLRQAVNKF